MHPHEHGRGRLTRPRLLAAAVTLVVVAAALAWWLGRGLDVVPAPAAADPACARAARSYPATLGPLERRSLGVTAAAAYGDPAVIVRCGMPALGPTSDECIDISGVDWVVHPLSDGTRMTTYGRTPALEALVPSAHAPAPLLMPALGDAARRLPQNGHRCVG